MLAESAEWWHTHKGHGAEIIDFEHFTPLIYIAICYCIYPDHCTMIKYYAIKLTKILDRQVYRFLCNRELFEMSSKGSDLLRMLTIQFVERLLTPSK